MGGYLRPGDDYLLRRKLTSFWRELPHSPMAADMAWFLAAAAELGFTERTPLAVGSQVLGRLLIQTGRGLDQLPKLTAHAARQVLFHLGVLDQPPLTVATQLRQASPTGCAGRPRCCARRSSPTSTGWSPPTPARRRPARRVG